MAAICLDAEADRGAMKGSLIVQNKGYIGLLALLIGISTRAGAAQYVVDGANPKASDTNVGTAAMPFKTIGKAAQIAVAGDIVLIKPGKYAESITVQNSGQEGKPIVFAAPQPRSVIITNLTGPTLFQPARNANGKWSSFYITAQGLVFGETPSTPNNQASAVLVAKGWRLEDCTVERNEGAYFSGAQGEVDDVTFLRTIFQDCYGNGLVGVGNDYAKPPTRVRNTLVKDCIFRRNNRSNLSPGGYSGANKMLWTQDLTFDGVISYDNNGSGTWFDYSSANFTVRDCTFFGNHAGWGVEPNGSVGNQSWAGVGFWSEANHGPGLIEHCVFYSNLASAIGDLDSGSQGTITIHSNRIVDCGGCIEFRGMDDHAFRRLGQALVTDNLFKAWHNQAWNTSVEENIPSDTPEGLGIVLDSNIYDPKANFDGNWASWKPSKASEPTQARGLQAIRSKLQAEPHGKQEEVAFRGPLIPVFAYPPEAEAKHPNPAKLTQVHSEQAERLSIDQAIRDAGTSRIVTIPVFGRNTLRLVGKSWTCNIYDLQAGYVHLLLPNSKAKQALEQAVTDYAIIRPTYLKVKLTVLKPYDKQATLLDVK